MLPFLHGRAQQMLRLMELCNRLMRLYNERNLGLGDELAAFLGEAARVYGDLGRREVEGRVLALRAELNTAHRGVSPLTFQAVCGRRRELESTISFKVLQAIAHQIGSDIQQGDRELQDGRTLLVPLLLAAFQRGYIPDAKATSASAPETEELWRRLSADPEIGLAAKRVALTVSLSDTVLLLQDMLADVEPPAPVGPRTRKPGVGRRPRSPGDG